MGWLPDSPDSRDYSIETAVNKLIREQRLSSDQEIIKLRKAKFSKADESPILKRALRLVPEDKVNPNKNYFLLLLKTTLDSDQRDFGYQFNLEEENKNLYLPNSVDLRKWFSIVKTQGNLKSCTAQAAVALVEYFGKRAIGDTKNFSRLFLYKIARKLMQQTGDSGASIRSTMKALELFGIVPEKFWSYDTNKFDEEPSAFCYAYAQNYQATSYFKIDQAFVPSKSCFRINQPSLLKEDTLDTVIRIRIALASGFPTVFGFETYPSLFNKKTIESGKIPFPKEGESVEGHHAVVAVGYDDDKAIKGYTGAFRIRNSWGQDWGKDGYGWLPYEYVLRGLATDWWSLIKTEWVASGSFGLTIGDDGMLGDACISPCVR